MYTTAGLVRGPPEQMDDPAVNYPDVTRRRVERDLPWRRHAADVDAWMSFDNLRRGLQRPLRPHEPVDPAQPAASVLLPVFLHGDELRIVLIERSMHVSSNPGEVALPGGIIDPGETPLAAALREAHEEIGLEPAEVEVIAPLPPHIGRRSRLNVHPFVGLIAHDVAFVPHAREVARVFDIAVADLLRRAQFWEEHWDIIEAQDEPIVFFRLDEALIWGLTGRILIDLLRAAMQGAGRAHT